MKRRIGIVGYERNDMFGIHSDYLAFVERFGTPVIIPPVERKDFFHRYKIEGLILPGGSDVSPDRYSRSSLEAWLRKTFFCYPSDPNLEHFDREILPGLIHQGFPVFGICRGLQTLNVHFGGTLKNLRKHPYSMAKDHMVHKLLFDDGYEGKANSFHHQAIDRLAEDFNVIATASDGEIEVIRHKRLPVAAVQYHPERFEDWWSVKMCEILFE